MKALEINHLRKTFQSNFLWRKYHVLNDITLSAEKGEIYGYLGANGAGKTTTIKCVMGLLYPDSGEILIDQSPAHRIELRRKLGFLPENPYFYDYLDAAEYLHFTGMLFGWPRAKIKPRITELLHTVGLDSRGGLKLRKYSKGMIQRLGLAQAMFNDPEILILDEPFSGLDPIGRKDLRDLILSLKNQGKTIFFSSHILQDMELIVDRVGILRDGRIIREGALSELIARSVQYVEIVCRDVPEALLAGLPHPRSRQEEYHIIRVEEESAIDPLLHRLLGAGARIAAVQPVKMTLEDIYLQEVKAQP